jgi:pimeloyl-ACP methyl ester carboxylesterase
VVRVLEATQVPIFAKNFDAKVNQPAWKSKPSWYLIATQDRMIPPALQQSMSARMKAQVASVDASHVPMASRPDEVANFIASAAEAAR